MKISTVARLRARGFDLSSAVPFERAWDVRCSQCSALVINGVPCHERGCPHEAYTGSNTDDDESHWSGEEDQ